MADAETSQLNVKLQMLHEDVGEMKKVLQELTSAITKLAVVEERQAQTSAGLERAFKALEKVEARLAALEQQAPINKQTSDWAGKVVWGLASAVGMYVLAKIGLVK